MIQTSEHIQRIAEARHRLEVLFHDASYPNLRIVLPAERSALRTLLDELHRLHLAVSEQGKTLKSIAERRNKASRKPSAARTPQPTAHAIRARKESLPAKSRAGHRS